MSYTIDYQKFECYYLRAQGGNMNLQKANDYTKKLFNTNWVKWVHEGTKPAESNAEKSV